LRRQLETSVLAARHTAESASRAAVEGLGVFADRRPDHLDADQARLRNGLRAKGRQLGGDRELLVAECAYEQWHRLLFARFLSENGLLLHPQFKAPVSLADCGELAAGLGEPDAWSVAARFAAEILPGIFRLDDPCVRLRLAPEGRHALEQILDALPAETFAADDALGWVYQFWQKDKKDQINASERKIDGAELGPITQLFTEDYMVRFLLENSLGAWWATRHPDSPLLDEFGYLRFDDDGRPAGESFEGWPDRVAELTVMDPCCGSGHFLVVAFSMLWRMRAEEEGLTAVDAQDAVLRDNLFGLELDPRCVQIAMFAVALQAWKAGGGWRQLPVPNIACSGIPVKAPVEEWERLAGGDAPLKGALVRLHRLFRDADVLGSLIDPRQASGREPAAGPERQLEDVDWSKVAPAVARVVAQEQSDPASAVLGADATSTTRAAAFLSRKYDLVVTNPPYLVKGRLASRLKRFVESAYLRSSWELAIVFFERAMALLSPGGCVAFVTPQPWLTLTSYRQLRRGLLTEATLSLVARLGPGAFETISGEVVQPLLVQVRREAPGGDHRFLALDVAEEKGIAGKSGALRQLVPMSLSQRRQLDNADHRIVLGELGDQPLLATVADGIHGLGTKDSPRFIRFFWERPLPHPDWELMQSSPSATGHWAGMSKAVYWQRGTGTLNELAKTGAAILAGDKAHGRPGVLVGQVGDLPCCLYHGGLFEKNAAVISPHSPQLVPAIFAYCSSPEFRRAVRQIDQKVAVTNRTLVKVPFDADRWRKAAEEAGPLPEPRSDDPTQWLFKGRPEASAAPLQVAVARLVGYRWPGQVPADDLEALADADGIVCLPSVAGEAPAADRLQQLLAAAFGEAWTRAKLEELLEAAGGRKRNLAGWLRDEFFKQHCALFGNRPFVWHVWDGRNDGFSALVDYHRLDRKTLEKLTYTYLGQDWLERQRADVRDEVAGAEVRLAAAIDLQRKLEAVLEGEAPYDIYVRWKPPHEQAVGWEPDPNDGVRLNVRPFVQAGVLRVPFNVHWRKDRGKNRDGTERENDKHIPLADKLGASKRAEPA
jgi:Eco57I restriction-modification methylase